MALNVDILANFQGVDNVTPVAQQIDQSFGGMMGNAQARSGGLMNSMRELGGIFQGLNGMVMGVFGAYGLSSFKNMTYGTATAREQIYQLYQTTAGTTAEADALWDKMDELTNHGYVSLDQLGQAMNILGMSTGASVEQMDTMVTLINEVGNRAILMGYDANRTQNLMNSTATGLNGNLDMLNNAFGITKKKLMDMGWKGTVDDVEGYTNALKQYLGISDDMNDHLSNTQGKVISLQKRFRIAGRNLGNYMLPPINAIMDAFTNLNAQSNDLLASLIIVGTGAMSGFASILPTLSPLIQLYDFFEKRTLNLSLGGIPDLVKANTLTGRLYLNIRDLIASPIAGWLRYWTRSNFLPYLDNARTSLYRFYITHIRYSSTLSTATGLFNRFSGTTLSGLGKVSRAFGTAQIKIAQFVGTYGSLEGRANALMRVLSKSDRLELLGNSAKQNIMNQGNLASKATSFLQTRNYGGVAQNKGDFMTNKVQQYTDAIKNSRIALEAERLANQKNVLGKIASAFWSGEDATATISSASAKAIATSASTYEALANADNNTQLAVANTLRLFEMGIIDEEVLARMLLKFGIIDEATARKLGNIAAEEEIVVKQGLIGTNGLLSASTLAVLWPILLIVGAIVALIVVIDQIGKTLGWWDNWKEMLDAIVRGLQRLWSAFINNPNVQGFIKDIQWVFGELGKAVQWVAWQVLQFFGWEDTGEEVDIVRMIIDAFGALGDMLGKIVNAVKWFFTVTAPIWQAIFTVATGPIRALIGLLKGIYCIIFGCSPGIIPAIQRLRDIFMSIFPYIAMALGGPIGIIIGLFTGLFKNINIVDKIRSLGSKFFTVARQIGQMLWNGLNSVIGGIPQKVWNTFMTMITNLTRIPQMVFNKGKEFGQSIYNGMDSAVSGLTGGLVHLPGATNQGQAKQNAKTMGNATKNYNNSRNVRGGHTINIGKGAIQLDARNLTTKESKQIMINALEGLTTYETVHTKKAQGK